MSKAELYSPDLSFIGLFFLGTIVHFAAAEGLLVTRTFSSGERLPFRLTKSLLSEAFFIPPFPNIPVWAFIPPEEL